MISDTKIQALYKIWLREMSYLKEARNCFFADISK